MTSEPTDTTPTAEPEPTCCGEKLWPKGGPIQPACQLCEKSPSYFDPERLRGAGR